MESYSSITLVTFDEQVFPEVQEEVVLLLAQGCRQGRTDHIEWRQCGTIADFPGAHSKEFYPQPNGEKWTKGLAETPAVDLLSSCEADGFCRLGDWGSISLGTVTGNNSFFAVSKATAEHWHLDDGDTLPLSPPGSRHLRGVSLTRAKMSELSEAGKQVLLFYPGPSKPPSKAAEAYIEHGVELGVPKGYKCRNRSPWWKVPLSGKPDIFITYMNDYAPSLCSNLAGAYCLNSVHGLRLHAEFRQIGRAFLPLACMNSATLLSSEIEGRAYGGGILKVEPREAANLLVPSPSLLSACLPDLDRIAREEGALLGSGKISEACDIVDAVLAGHVGSLGKSGFEALRDEKDRLYGRRKARARKA